MLPYFGILSRIFFIAPIRHIQRKLPEISIRIHIHTCDRFFIYSKFHQETNPNPVTVFENMVQPLNR